MITFSWSLRWHLSTYSQHHFYAKNTIQRQLQLNIDSCLGVQHSRELLFLTNSGLFSSRSWTATSWSCQAELKSLLHSTTVDVWRCSVRFVSSVRPLTSSGEGEEAATSNFRASCLLFTSLLCSHSVSRYCSSKSGGRKVRRRAVSFSHTLPAALSRLSGLDRPSVRKWVRESASRARNRTLSLFYQKRSSSKRE